MNLTVVKSDSHNKKNRNIQLQGQSEGGDISSSVNNDSCGRNSLSKSTELSRKILPNITSRTPFSLLDLNKETIREAFEFPFGIEHRLEHVCTIEGVSYWNDSKATNVNSTWFALESTPGPIILICGGQDKGNDYTDLIPLVGEKVRGIIYLAKDPSWVRNVFSKIVPLFFETESMEQAVRQAYTWSRKGDSVLLSPTSASFDLFENYEDRGWQFKKAVRAL